MVVILPARAVLAGSARGPALRLAAPLSFWGGVDPRTGRITDPACPALGRAVGGTVLMLPATRGSSSSSAVLLELIHAGLAPAAIVLGAIDAIVGLGILVAQELGLPTIPLLLLAPAEQARVPDGTLVGVAPDGRLTIPPPAGPQ